MEKIRMLVTALLVFALPVSVMISCDEGIETDSMSCGFEESYKCIDLVGNSYMNSDCTEMGGSIIKSCSGENLVGVCTIDGDYDHETKIYYYSPGYTSRTASIECSNRQGNFSE